MMTPHTDEQARELRRNKRRCIFCGEIISKKNRNCLRSPLPHAEEGYFPHGIIVSFAQSIGGNRYALVGRSKL